jgi:membrane protease YdiL (CAAX protease family)
MLIFRLTCSSMEPIEEPNPGIEQHSFVTPIAEPAAPKSTIIAPVWHTVALILAIAAVSFIGVYRHPGGQGAAAVNRLRTYGVTAILELALMGWVAFGLRLKGISLTSLFGRVSNSLRSIALDAGIAILFWMGSLMVLGTIAVMWMSIDSLIHHRPIAISSSHNGKSITPDPSQEKAARAVVQLAPTNGKEVVCWLLLCMLVGVAEELVFRGYLQQQFAAWSRGAPVGGVVFSAIMFGSAHGYEGARAMFLLAVFGSLFSLLALFRRNLRAGIFAHSWHDAFAGLTVAFLHARHVL